MRPVSAVAIPRPTSCSARNVTGSMIPTAPKSMNQMVPSPSTRMLPGWGSAWNVPDSSIATRNARKSRSASTGRGIEHASTAAASETGLPWTRSITRTTSLVIPVSTCGTSTPSTWAATTALRRAAPYAASSV